MLLGSRPSTKPMRPPCGTSVAAARGPARRPPSLLRAMLQGVLLEPSLARRHALPRSDERGPGGRSAGRRFSTTARRAGGSDDGERRPALRRDRSCGACSPTSLASAADQELSPEQVETQVLAAADRWRHADDAACAAVPAAPAARAADAPRSATALTRGLCATARGLRRDGDATVVQGRCSTARHEWRGRSAVSRYNLRFFRAAPIVVGHGAAFEDGTAHRRVRHHPAAPYRTRMIMVKKHAKPARKRPPRAKANPPPGSRPPSAGEKGPPARSPPRSQAPRRGGAANRRASQAGGKVDGATAAPNQAGAKAQVGRPSKGRQGCPRSRPSSPPKPTARCQVRQAAASTPSWRPSPTSRRPSRMPPQRRSGKGAPRAQAVRRRNRRADRRQARRRRRTRRAATASTPRLRRAS